MHHRPHCNAVAGLGHSPLKPAALCRIASFRQPRLITRHSSFPLTPFHVRRRQARRPNSALPSPGTEFEFTTGGGPSVHSPFIDLAEGLETPVQLIYLATLLGFLVVGAFLVVRQVLIRRELEEAAKVLGERIRLGEASAEDYFELGVILLRKKLFTQATKNLEKAKKGWEGESIELAQVHNALGYAYFNMERLEAAVDEYKAAVELQPGYVTAWNNLGDAYEKRKMYRPALEAYQEALSYAPDNQVARARADYCKTRLERSGGLI